MENTKTYSIIPTFKALKILLRKGLFLTLKGRGPAHNAMQCTTCEAVHGSPERYTRRQANIWEWPSEQYGP